MLRFLQSRPNISGHLRGFEQLVRLLDIRHGHDLAESSADGLRRSVVVPVTQIDRVDAVAQNFEDGVDGSLIDALVLTDDESKTHAVKRTRAIPPVSRQERDSFELVLA